MYSENKIFPKWTNVTHKNCSLLHPSSQAAHTRTSSTEGTSFQQVAKYNICTELTQRYLSSCVISAFKGYGWLASWFMFNGTFNKPIGISRLANNIMTDRVTSYKRWLATGWKGFLHVVVPNYKKQEAQLSQRDRATACLNFGKNISAKSVHLTWLYVTSLTSTNHHFTVLWHHLCT